MKTPLQIHMENKSEEGKQININSVKEYALKIKVDTTELDEAIKKFKKMNKLVEKVKCPNGMQKDGMETSANIVGQNEKPYVIVGY